MNKMRYVQFEVHTHAKLEVKICE